MRLFQFFTQIHKEIQSKAPRVRETSHATSNLCHATQSENCNKKLRNIDNMHDEQVDTVLTFSFL